MLDLRLVRLLPLHRQLTYYLVTTRIFHDEVLDIKLITSTELGQPKGQPKGHQLDLELHDTL